MSDEGDMHGTQPISGFAKGVLLGMSIDYEKFALYATVLDDHPVDVVVYRKDEPDDNVGLVPVVIIYEEGRNPTLDEMINRMTDAYGSEPTKGEIEI